MFTQVWGGVAGGFTTHPRPQGDMRGPTRMQEAVCLAGRGFPSYSVAWTQDERRSLNVMPGTGAVGEPLLAGGALTHHHRIYKRGGQGALPIHTKNRVVPATPARRGFAPSQASRAPLRRRTGDSRNARTHSEKTTRSAQQKKARTDAS